MGPLTLFTCCYGPLLTWFTRCCGPSLPDLHVFMGPSNLIYTLLWARLTWCTCCYRPSLRLLDLHAVVGPLAWFTGCYGPPLRWFTRFCGPPLLVSHAVVGPLLDLHAVVGPPCLFYTLLWAPRTWFTRVMAPSYLIYTLWVQKTIVSIIYVVKKISFRRYSSIITSKKTACDMWTLPTG